MTRASIHTTDQLLDWIAEQDTAPRLRRALLDLAARADDTMQATVTTNELAARWGMQERSAFSRLYDLRRAGLIIYSYHPDDEADEDLPAGDSRRVIKLMHPSTPWKQHREQEAVDRAMFFAIAPELMRRRKERMREREEALRRGHLKLAGED